MGRQMITTNAQYLGLPLLELAMQTPEEDGLLGSTRGEVEHVKRQNDVLLATVLTEADIAFRGRWQGKIWRLITNVCRHGASFRAKRKNRTTLRRVLL
jgi:hypothetical protein